MQIILWNIKCKWAVIQKSRCWCFCFVLFCFYIHFFRIFHIFLVFEWFKCISKQVNHYHGRPECWWNERWNTKIWATATRNKATRKLRIKISTHKNIFHAFFFLFDCCCFFFLSQLAFMRGQRSVLCIFAIFFARSHFVSFV